ncbi:hypothetical protein FHG87_019710 [Trinorchestia longiramus]|nr:hypothetical protein FHG87_019710 [Trinorchestia longiramus]
MNAADTAVVLPSESAIRECVERPDFRCYGDLTCPMLLLFLPSVLVAVCCSPGRRISSSGQRSNEARRNACALKKIMLWVMKVHEESPEQERHDQEAERVRRVSWREGRLMDDSAGGLPGAQELYTDDAKAANGLTAAVPRTMGGKRCLQCGCHGGPGGRSSDDHLQQLQELVQRQQQDLSHRDSELERLRSLVGGGGGGALAAVVRDSCTAAVQDQLQHVKQQHAILQDQHHLLKTQMQQLQCKYDAMNVDYMELKKKFNTSLHSNHEAMQRAVVLSEQLQQAAYANVQLEVDRNQASSALSHTVKCAQGKLEWAESDLDKQQRLYHLMKQERDSLLAEIVQVRHENSRLSHQHGRLQEQHAPLLERCSALHQDKKQLVDKINRLTVQVEERLGAVARLEGQLEVAQASLERLQRENKELISDKNALTEQVSDVSRRLEETQQERQYYKEESETTQQHRDDLQQQLEDLIEAKGVIEQRLEDVEGQRSSATDVLRQTRDGMQALQQRHRQTEAKLAKVRAERQAGQEECEQYKEQVQELLLMLQGGRADGEASPVNGASVDETLGRIRQERDLMKHELKFLKSKLKAAHRERDQAAKSLAEARSSDAEDGSDMNGALASARSSARSKDGARATPGRAGGPRAEAGWPGTGTDASSAGGVNGVLPVNGFDAPGLEYASDEADLAASDADYPATSGPGYPGATAADRRAGYLAKEKTMSAVGDPSLDLPSAPQSGPSKWRGLKGILRTSSRGSRSLVSSNGSPASEFSGTRSDAALGDVAGGLFEVSDSGVADTANGIAAGGVAASLGVDDASRKWFPTSTGLPFSSTHPSLADFTASVGATAMRPSPASVLRTFGVPSASQAATVTGIALTSEFDLFSEPAKYVTAGPTQVTAVVTSAAHRAAPTFDSVAASVSPPYSPPSLASSSGTSLELLSGTLS